MGEVITIGLDIAKSVFQVHGIDDAGTVLIRKRVSRAKVLEFFAELPPCLVGIEACPSAHHWGRELQQRTKVVAGAEWVLNGRAIATERSPRGRAKTGSFRTHVMLYLRCSRMEPGPGGY